jgi:hypothetical protein
MEKHMLTILHLKVKSVPNFNRSLNISQISNICCNRSKILQVLIVQHVTVVQLIQ